MTHTSKLAVLCMGAATLLCTGAALAAPSAAQLLYQQERAACMNGTSNQDRATCLREAAAALQEARRGNLSTGDLTQNSIARCNGLPADDRADCVSRIQAGVTTGTARDGGILREYTRPARTN